MEKESTDKAEIGKLLAENSFLTEIQPESHPVVLARSPGCVVML